MPYRYIRIVKEIGSRGWRAKRIGTEDAVARFYIWISGHNRPERSVVKAAGCIKRTGCNIAREERSAVVASPERRKARARLCEHLPREFPAARNQVHPTRNVCSVPAAAAVRRLNYSLADEPMPGCKGIVSEISLGLELVVSRSS